MDTAPGSSLRSTSHSQMEQMEEEEEGVPLLPNCPSCDSAKCPWRCEWDPRVPARAVACACRIKYLFLCFLLLFAPGGSLPGPT